ncbi:MAG: hypothetical protein COA67_04880, partial [Lutibacter sp.]
MKKLISLFIVLFTINSFAQGEASKWYFGQGAAVDFNGGVPTNIAGSLLNTNEGCSSFADSSGNLLFYIGSPTLGGTQLTIWDRNNNPMPNADANASPTTGLEGDASSAQSALTVPAPNQPVPGQIDIYYIFTVGASSSGNAGFFYYTLDMRANGGFGDIVGGVTNLHFDSSSINRSGTWTEKVTAVKGDDCNTFWVVSQYNIPGSSNGHFIAYKVDTTGVVIATPTYSTVDDAATDVRGYLKVSPNGEKLVTAHYTTGGTSLLILYTFDNATGSVSNDGEILIDTSRNPGDGAPYGVEFNNNSDKLYASTHDGSRNNAFQFDLTSTDITSTKTLINSRFGRFRGALQLAQDGKIYATTPFSYSVGTPFLDVIENPNDDAIDIIYTEDAVNLGSGLAMQGLPPFISSIFSGIEITGDDGNGNTIILNDITLNLCSGENLDIAPEPITGSGTISYNWYFNGSTTPFASVSDISFTNVTPAINGIYKLEVNFTDICGEVTNLEGEFNIEVFDVPTAVQPPNMLICDDDNNGTMPFTLTNQDATINTTTGMSVSYYLSQAEADAGTTGALTSPYESASTTIYARVENDGNAPCYDTTSFDLEVYESAFPSTTVSLLGECDNTSVGTITDGFIEFNLHDRATEILNGQAAADFTLTYFTDAAYTIQIPVPTETAFQNAVAGGQPIYVRMTNNLNTNCFTDTSFDLVVYEQPTAVQPTNMVQCDDDNNGTMPFTLTDQNATINTDAGMSITYYLSQAEADAGTTGALSSPYESGSTTIYARVENDINTPCYDTTSFDLEVYDSAFPSTTVSLLAECDNTSVGTDADGFIEFNLHDRATEILNGQAAADFTLTYFTNATYTTQIPVANETAFQNTVVDGQTIYVRMTNNLNSNCFTDTSFDIEVYKLPILNSPPFVLEQCDDDFDGFNSFNLSEINTDIITTITTEVFTYYELLADAEAGVLGTEIINPTTYTNQIVNTDNTIWARAENVNGCYRTTQFTLVVKPSAIPPTFLRTFSQCDDGTDDRDGVATFDFSSVTAEVQAMFPTAIDVFYYRNQADATAETNEITDPSNYENIGYPNMQEVWVRADSQLGNDCLGNGHHITLIVEALPTANAPTTIMKQCDDDSDGMFPFNVTTITSEILNGQSLADVTITYFNEDGTPITGI